MGHIPKNHYVNFHFYADEVGFIRNLAWVRDIYGALRQYDMVKSFRNDPTAFQRVVQCNGTALAMAYFKAREVEMCERGYRILEDVGDPIKKKYLGVVDLPIQELDSFPKKTMESFFKTL